MRRTSLLVAAACMAGSAQLAYGADLPVKAPVYKASPVTVYNWTGFYVGGDVGYGWGTIQNTATTASGAYPVGFVFAPEDLTGVVAGGHAGYNYQMDHVVVGIEGDFDWTDMKGSASDVSPVLLRIPTTTETTGKVTWLADITGRVGYAWDSWLLYAKGGAAWAHTEASSVTTGQISSTSSGSETRSGWLIGGGLEWGFMPHWSAKAEYNFMDFGTKDVVRVSDTGTINHRDSTMRVNVVKAGISYHF